jgi:hypothetical protein
MPIPDLDQPTDSARTMQESLEKMRAEAAERAQAKQVAEQRRLARAEADKRKRAGRRMPLCDGLAMSRPARRYSSTSAVCGLDHPNRQLRLH